MKEDLSLALEQVMVLHICSVKLRQKDAKG